jgi:Family of unknown function (DUF6325)
VIGPVQVLVVGFDEPTFSGEVLAELRRLREAGIVRLIDVLLVSRTEDGTLETLEAPEGFASDLGGVAGEILGQPAVAADAEPAPTKIEADPDPDAAETEFPAMWSLADAIPTGSTAAVALIEHVWAAPLSAAIQRAGGTALEETWLAQQDMELLESLMARQDR